MMNIIGRRNAAFLLNKTTAVKKHIHKLIFSLRFF